jgi:hypothetical protein
VKLKRESILNPTAKAVSNAEYRLKELLTVNKRPPALSLILLQRQSKKRKCDIPIKTIKLEVFHATIKPKDGRLFTVFEIVITCWWTRRLLFLVNQPIKFTNS